MQISTGLPRPGPLALCILKATMKGVYRLPHTVASPCQTLRKLLAWRPQVNVHYYSPTHQLAVPRMPRVCTLVLIIVISNSRFALINLWSQYLHSYHLCVVVQTETRLPTHHPHTNTHSEHLRIPSTLVAINVRQ